MVERAQATDGRESTGYKMVERAQAIDGIESTVGKRNIKFTFFNYIHTIFKKTKTDQKVILSTFEGHNGR